MLDLISESAWDIQAAESQALPEDEAAALAEKVPALVEAAIASEPLGVSVTSARDDLLLLGRTLAAAVLVDDATVLEELLEWQNLRHRSHPDVLPTDELIARLSAQIPAEAPKARALLSLITHHRTVSRRRAQRCPR